MPREKDTAKISAIHSATREIVIRVGFGGLKMSEVAKSARVATGTLYVYYSGKEALINDVFACTKQEMALHLFANHDETQSYFLQFKSMWYNYLDYCIRHPDHMLFVEQFLHSGYITESTITQTDQWFLPLDRFLEWGKDQQIVRNAPLDLIKAHLQGSVHEMVRTSLSKNIPWNTERKETAFHFAWAGVRQ